ncbi:hypothetical protein Moror_11505 [Moniliophthora roreri MCA 2997]|uniref:Uncharacterized protein n=1 Tax=Moniliophthora roreri (strain MCA 2997) TaxID=1381753 RepID=V2WV10_MONRO|nr:hypothetical protein Moror_11505 [Moniliophthora roreri MCA 2997]
MSQSYTYDNLHPTALQLLYLLNNTTYRERIINAAQNLPLIDHLLANYQFVQQQHQHFNSLLTAANLQLNRIAVNVAASGFMIPGQLMITPPPSRVRHLPQVDWNILLDTPQRPLRTISSSRMPDPHQLHRSPSTVSIQTGSIDPNHLQVLSPEIPPTPPPQDEPPHPQNPSPDTSDSESNLAQRSRTSLSQPKNNSTKPLPLSPVFHILSPQMITPGPPGLLETGLPQRTPGTPPPGLSDQSPSNNPLKNNIIDETTEPESRRSSLPTNLVSMTDFLDVIGAISRVTIHRTVETTNAQSATHSNLTIYLTIAHNFDTVNEFLSQALPELIRLLMALRMTTVTRPLSATLPTSPTSTEDEEEPLVYTVVCITDNREPFTMTTEDGEERHFVPVRYVNGAVVFEAGTSNINRG